MAAETRRVLDGGRQVVQATSRHYIGQVVTDILQILGTFHDRIAQNESQEGTQSERVQKCIEMCGSSELFAPGDPSRLR